MEVAYYWMTNPTLLGPGARYQLAEKAKGFGMTKVLIVSDPGIKAAGVLDEPIKLLKDAGIEVVTYTEVNADPLDTKCYEGADICKKEKCNGIIAIGGGSVMDSSKAMNILQNNPAPLDKYYGSWDYKRGIPLICVPTTAGTGSENTIYGVISSTTTNTKKVVLYCADLAICDPELTYKLPPHLTASTGLDAFAHCAEAVTCNIYNPLTETLAMDGISRICKWLPIAYKDPTNTEARQQMMLAANFGGIAFSATCCHLGHAISQCMGAAFHVPHGISCAWALPEVMAYSAIGKPDKVKVVAKFLGVDFKDSDPANVIGNKVADNIRSFMRLMDVKSIKDYGISREDLINICDIVMADNCFPFIPSPLDREGVREILAKVYDTYQ
jgi:alcohol dehydrogenase class IV